MPIWLLDQAGWKQQVWPAGGLFYAPPLNPSYKEKKKNKQAKKPNNNKQNTKKKKPAGVLKNELTGICPTEKSQSVPRTRWKVDMY